MFFKKNPLKKKLKKAKELLQHAKKIYNYRRDLLASKDVEELIFAREELESLIGQASVSEGNLDSAINRLERVCTKSGGYMYPVRFIPDNVETILVAAILAIGIRTFFFQPFTIPTNSMYPTYAGMLFDVYHSDEEEPSVVDKLFRKVFKSSSHYEIKAPVSGEVRLPLNSGGGVYSRIVPSRKWFGLLPDRQIEYTLLVGDQPVAIRVPLDFQLEEVLREAYFPESKDYREMLMEKRALGGIDYTDMGPVLSTGKLLSKGENVLNFDILGGDMLFVDRISYHFKRPQIGDAIVFRTENIPGMKDERGNPVEKYFIKRLVGQGGDKLEVEEPKLLRNGEPIAGVEAFELNQAQVGNYSGYAADRALSPGETVTVPEGFVYAMGDNSPHSQDSRYWGPVPEKELIGKAAFIFYPFTHRWGLAK